VLAAVALGNADDQLFADVAREIEIDVGYRRELAVEEAAERELVRDRIDVREAGQVADERADRRAATAARRQDDSLEGANEFLKTWVPRILASPAYKQDGLLLVTFDEAEVQTSPPSGDASACCNQPPGPSPSRSISRARDAT